MFYFCKDPLKKEALIKLLKYSLKDECQLILLNKQTEKEEEPVFIKRSAIAFQKVHENEITVIPEDELTSISDFSVNIDIADVHYPTRDINRPEPVSDLISSTILSIINETK